MKKFTQGVLIVWFIVVNLFILIPSYNLLNIEKESENSSIDPPRPPNVLVIKDLNTSDPDSTQKNQIAIATQQALAYTQQINVYTQQVNAYKEQISLAKLQLENTKKGSQMARYTAVIKDVLSTLLTGFVAALITFAFVNAGTGLADNYIRVKNNQAPVPIKFW